MNPRVRQWVTRRSMLLHLAFVMVAGGCGLAAWWQVHRAMQGNTLSYLYSVEWPAFAVVAGIGWWQMFHDTPEDIAKRRAYHEKMRAASAEVVARTLPRSARALTVSSDEVDGRGLSAGSRPPGIPSSTSSASGSMSAAADLVTTRSSSLVSPDADAGARILEPDDDRDGVYDDPMSEYNRYLATLAVKGKPKTWRNPRGV